jgi:hypothetical protein
MTNFLKKWYIFVKIIYFWGKHQIQGWFEIYGIENGHLDLQRGEPCTHDLPIRCGINPKFEDSQILNNYNYYLNKRSLLILTLELERKTRWHKIY